MRCFSKRQNFSPYHTHYNVVAATKIGIRTGGKGGEGNGGQKGVGQERHNSPVLVDAPRLESPQHFVQVFSQAVGPGEGRR